MCVQPHKENKILNIAPLMIFNEFNNLGGGEQGVPKFTAKIDDDAKGGGGEVVQLIKYHQWGDIQDLILFMRLNTRTF